MQTYSNIATTGMQISLALVAVSLVTWVDFRQLHVNSSTAAFSYLLVILALAARTGLVASVAASLAGMLAYNYFFLPPIGTFTIADPENWTALVVFLVTAITASHLSSSARKRAEEAASREHELGRMYEFSRALMLRDPDRTIALQTTHQIREVFGFAEVCFYDLATDEVSGSTPEIVACTPTTLRHVARTGEVWRQANKEGGIAIPVGLGGRRLGSIGVAGPVASSEVALQAVAQLVAIAIERSHSQDAANRVEATRQNEQLKSTLLDALAHEFKTPLTSIKAATTSVLPRTNLDSTNRELITIIDEEADRLTRLVNDAIELARIGSGPVTLNREPCSAAELIASAVTQLRILLEDRELALSIEDDLLSLMVDRQLSELVFRQLIGNALKYSPPSSPIRVAVCGRVPMALIRIKNTGLGIPQGEQATVFEKFYRSKDTRTRVAGTGMGLAIAREIIAAHGGSIWVESNPNQGAEFSFTLPLVCNA